MAQPNTRRPDHGQGVVEVDETDAGPSSQQLRIELFTALKSPAYRPPQLPTVALELLELSRRPEVAPAALNRVLDRDPMMAARVLRIARSAIYAGRAEVRTLLEAIQRIGTRSLGELVMEATVHDKVFRAGPYTEIGEQVRQHSSVVARVARVVCRLTSFSTDHAFLCGLLHDVGTAVLLLLLGEKKKERPDPVVVWPVIQGLHGEAGGLLCRHWKLPSDVQLVVQHHHQRSIQGVAHPMVAVIMLAEALAASIGFGDVVPGASAPKLSASAFDQALTDLGIHKAAVPTLMKEATRAKDEALSTVA